MINIKQPAGANFRRSEAGSDSLTRGTIAKIESGAQVSDSR